MIMNILNIILLSCSLAVTVAQKVTGPNNDFINGQRYTGGYGLLRPGSQGGYNQGGYNQGGYNQGGYNQGGYNQGGYNQGGYNQGGNGFGAYNGYGSGTPGYGQGPGGYQGYGQGYGGNQGYGQGYGGRPGYGGGGGPGVEYPGQGGYPGGYGGTGGYGGGGGYPGSNTQTFRPQYPGYRGGGVRYERPAFDPHFPELSNVPPERVSTNKFYEPETRPIITPYNQHTGRYYGGPDDRYNYSNNLRRFLNKGRKAGEIKEGDEKS